MMLARRLLTVDLNSRYADIMETCFYNNVITAINLDSHAFSYVNQLTSLDQDQSVREDWFKVFCCPPSLNRLFGTLSGYLWHLSIYKPLGSSVVTCLYIFIFSYIFIFDI
jgi:DUF1680 family protein